MSHKNIVALRKDIIDAIKNGKFIRLGGLLYRVLCASCFLDKPIVVTYSWVRDALLALSNGPVYDPMSDDNQLYHMFHPCDACFADKICNYMTIAMILLYSNLESADETKLTVIAPAKKALFELYGENPDWTTFHNRTFEGMFSDAYFSTDLNYTGEIFRVLAERCKFIEDPYYNETIETCRLGLADGYQLRYEGYLEDILRVARKEGMKTAGNQAAVAIDSLMKRYEKAAEKFAEQVYGKVANDIAEKVSDKVAEKVTDKVTVVIDERQSGGKGRDAVREPVYRLWLALFDDAKLPRFYHQHKEINKYLRGDEPPLEGKYAERVEAARSIAANNGKGPEKFWNSIYSIMRNKRKVKTVRERLKKSEIVRTIWTTEKDKFDSFEMF